MLFNVNKGITIVSTHWQIYLVSIFKWLFGSKIIRDGFADGASRSMKRTENWPQLLTNAYSRWHRVTKQQFNVQDGQDQTNRINNSAFYCC